MDRIKFSLAILWALIFLALSLWITGCKEKKQGEEKASSPPYFSALQPEIDRVRDIAFERSPARRPLPVSEAAPNRRQWTAATLNRGYEASGHTNAQWDGQAKRLFEDYARFSSGDVSAWPALEAGLRVVPTNCDDPMVQYMELRYQPVDLHRQAEPVASALLRVHELLSRSAYHPAFKFIAGVRAIDTLRVADPKSDQGLRIFLTRASLEDMVRDSNAPPELVFDMVQLWLQESQKSQWFDFVMHDLSSILEHNFGQQERWFRLRGWLEIERAWSARGTRSARSVSDDGWRAFNQHLGQAEQLLTNAWQMNSNQAETAYLMMRVELGQGRGQPRMQTWFQRAMELEPNNDAAARLMALYLEPPWYGSEREALEFGRSCVNSTNWGGRVPLVLVDTHHDLASFYKLTNSPAYWGQPQVWTDVRAAYEKFFALNGNQEESKQLYARDAYLCGRYVEFLEQIKGFSTGTNFQYFGGEAKFQEMLAKAVAGQGK